MDIFKNITKEEFKANVTHNIKVLSKCNLENATNEQIYEAVAFTIKETIADTWIKTNETYRKENPKILYYLSMEFLMGRFLGNSIINLNQYKVVQEALSDLGLDLDSIEDAEHDPGLGNGGLGRLAACFLDSLSTLELPAFGCGIRYHYGIFKQKIVNNEQVELPDNWLANGDSWGIAQKRHSKIVSFGGEVVTHINEDGSYSFGLKNTTDVLAIPYDYPIIGYNNNTINTLRLWDAQSMNDIDLEQFNQGDYSKANEQSTLAKTISEVLYPADEHIAGKELRLKQQYFFISATVQRAIERFIELNGKNFNDLPNYVAFQLNDTHPSVTVAELMRILIDEYNLSWDDAWEITKKTCAYTNHTIMSEALEKWPVELFSRILPRIYMIVEEINRRFCKNLIDVYGDDSKKISKMAIIADGQVKMAHLAIVGSHSVNGVAALHTEILKKQELKDFYEIYPKKFNNKTNGITQRRWLLHSNPELAKLITDSIGDEWITNLPHLENLMKFKDDKAFKQEFNRIKHANKIHLANYIKNNNGIDVDPNSIFDIQVKRLHEYKRQLLNILHVMFLYNQIKIDPNYDMTPQTFIFGAKSAAGYKKAKLIIKLINNVADVVNNDPLVSQKIKVVFLENYCVSLAEKLIPAANVSEQISTASKEASGTGNMKFMLNGALTIGTMDGANVEMFEEVGKDNIFIFGLSSDEVIDLYNNNSYNPWDILNIDTELTKVLTQLINGFVAKDDTEMFRELYESLVSGLNSNRPDEYFILKDFNSYMKAQRKLNKFYSDTDAFTTSAIINVAKSGKFSSDRTIKQYADEIWNLKKLTIQ